jgi:hypothetical protein
MLQPKSATEIGWRILKYINKTEKYVDYFLFQLVLIFPVAELDVGMEMLTWLL